MSSKNLRLEKTLGRKAKGTDIELVPSISKLDSLGFDPLESMVHLYKRLMEEDEYWLSLRKQGTINYVNNLPTGVKKRTVKYSSVAHAATLANMGKVANDLMRYKYARVPEVNEVPTAKSELNVFLTDIDDDSSIEDGEYEELDDDLSGDGIIDNHSEHGER